MTSKHRHMGLLSHCNGHGGLIWLSVSGVIAWSTPKFGTFRNEANSPVPLGNLRGTPGYPRGTAKYQRGTSNTNDTKRKPFFGEIFLTELTGVIWMHIRQDIFLLLNPARALKIYRKLWMYNIFTQKVSSGADFDWFIAFLLL